MAPTYKTPGVYRQNMFLQPETRLPTGVPGFVGFADAASCAGPKVNTPMVLHRKEEFAVHFYSRPESYLAEAISGFFDNGGVRCYVVHIDPTGDRLKAWGKALAALAPLTDLDLVAGPDAVLVAGPDAMSLRLANGQEDVKAVVQVQQLMLTHCAEQGDRVAILDAVPQATTAGVLEQREQLTSKQAEPVNGALYYPWLQAVNGRFVPPCGHVAGIFARSDIRAGVFKAPANEEVFGILDLETTIDNSIQDQLNPAGVNCLRVFRGRGIRVWGARTLSHDPNWHYVNVRRLFLTLRRWIDQHMAWATFEPNEPRLWGRIQRELSTYLTTLLRAGALRGATPEQAFYVKCDAETNPPEQREAGHVVTEIGLAPLAPAEFIAVRIIHRAGTTDIS